MNKKVLTLSMLILFIVIPLAYSQTAFDPFAMAQTGFYGTTGLTMIKEYNEEKSEWETNPYYRIQLQPEIDLGKIGVGLDVVMLYNPDKGTRSEDGEGWDSLSDYLRMMRYFRYGHRRDPLFFVYGALDNVFIGHGFIMGGYSNYDRRGLRFDVNYKDKLGVETMVNNLAEPNIFGGRFYIRPLIGMEGLPPLIDRLTFGASYIVDIDRNADSDTSENRNANGDISDKLFAYGLDASIPIYKRLGLELYDDLAFLDGYAEKEDDVGIGNAVGIGMSVSNLNFRVEYRIFNEYFQPTLFDYTYEYFKSHPEEDKNEAEGRATKGIYSVLTYSLMQKISLIATFEDYDGEGEFGEPKVYGELTESNLVDKVSFRALYVKRGIEGFEDIFDLDEKSALTLKIGYEFFSPLEIIFVREYRFRAREDEEGYETIHKTSVEMGVSIPF